MKQKKGNENDTDDEVLEGKHIEEPEEETDNSRKAAKISQVNPQKLREDLQKFTNGIQDSQSK